LVAGRFTWFGLVRHAPAPADTPPLRAHRLHTARTHALPLVNVFGCWFGYAFLVTLVGCLPLFPLRTGCCYVWLIRWLLFGWLVVAVTVVVDSVRCSDWFPPPVPPPPPPPHWCFDSPVGRWLHLLLLFVVSVVDVVVATLLLVWFGRWCSRCW